MSTEDITTLVSEVRSDFNIPPYFPDSSLTNFANEGIAYLTLLNDTSDFTGTRSQDVLYRTLLKNYIYYAFNNALSDYAENYAHLILTWQSESELESA